MSGSPSGTGGGGGRGPGSPPGEPVDCSSLTFTATLQSARAEAAASIAEGDVLEVTLNTEPVAVVVVNRDGHIVGAITKHLRQLIECLNSGAGFDAEVTVVDGGHIEVEVRPG